MEVYIEFIKRVKSKLDKEYYLNIIEKLNLWQNDKIRFSNKARFAILDYIDSIE